MTSFVEVLGLKKDFAVRRGIWQRQVGAVHAVDDVNFQLDRGKTLGLVGESGCGKTTVARMVVQLLRPTQGQVLCKGKDLVSMKGSELREIRPKIQMIFQDPYASLNPRMTVGTLIEEPLIEHTDMSRSDRHERVLELTQVVGLDPSSVERYPHEFSGGQRQRIGVARALALQPELLVCDEPVSALDLSIQAQIINLLEDIQDKFNLTYLFISHDLGIIRHICDTVAVMYLGKIVETGSAQEVYGDPQHPYTEALLASVPVANPTDRHQRKRIILSGEIPSSTMPPSGCNFHTRCPLAEQQCSETSPELRRLSDGRLVACHLV